MLRITWSVRRMREEDEDFPERVGVVAEVQPQDVDVVEPQDHTEELPGEVVDRREDRDEAEQVEPARDPAPPGAAELRRPPVDATRRRVGGRQLGHAEGDDEDEGRDDRPAPRDGDRAAVVPRLVVGREAAREDRDDREADREVLEAAPAPVELLLVAHLGKAFLVAARRRRHRARPLPGVKGLPREPTAAGGRMSTTPDLGNGAPEDGQWLRLCAPAPPGTLRAWPWGRP